MTLSRLRLARSRQLHRTERESRGATTPPGMGIGLISISTAASRGSVLGSLAETFRGPSVAPRSASEGKAKSTTAGEAASQVTALDPTRLLPGASVVFGSAVSDALISSEQQNREIEK